MRLLISMATVTATMTLGTGVALATETRAPIVGSTVYRDAAYEPDLAYNVGVPGRFDLEATAGDAVSFVWRTDDGQSGEVPVGADGRGTVTIAPRRAGVRSLTVHTVGKDGTDHAAYAYEFLVDNGPLVTRDPAGIVYLGSSPTFRMTPRSPGVTEYRIWPRTYNGERPEQAVTVPARADGSAETSWYLGDTDLAALLVQSRDSTGELSVARTVWTGPDEAAPVLTRTGGEDLITPATVTARTGMPGVVAYDVTFDGGTRTVTPDADGSATFTVTPARTGISSLAVTARNAHGLTTARTGQTWGVIDFPRVTSTDFPIGVTGPAGRKAPGTFQVATRRPGTTAFEWSFTGTDWATQPARADGTATITWTPSAVGSHTIQVRSVSADGTRSAVGGGSFSVAVKNGRVVSAVPATVTTGEKRTVTLHGINLHPLDVFEVTAAGRAPVPARIRSVDPDGFWAEAEIDFATVPAGRVSVTVKPYHGTVHSTLDDAITVAPLPALRATKAPAVSGTIKVGQTVKATAGTWSPAATTVRYQWRANGVVIGGATGASYRIAAPLAGKRLTVTVTATRSGHGTASATSAATVAVVKAAAPKAIKKPKVSGVAKVGRKVTVAVGTWTPTPGGYAYEWRLNGKVIKGATARTLKLTASMRGKRLTVTVIAKRAGHLDGRATSVSVPVRR
ncbi:hypothetical protein [Actinoplanes couchii]|uniref:Uncharacterized protein n=1 Tax=Actinoplanes couchii TaxID=403638 RepID=A0ABQ3XJ09_9ACTN|nr:hypothetical protein [Actinoplanes couchii]MDR6324015.1 hypothetical protein [Actinoplanes couchii]GID58484.1 hypothetical protein Aco03nite_068880 [Actinoplanes couchii]